MRRRSLDCVYTVVIEIETLQIRIRNTKLMRKGCAWRSASCSSGQHACFVPMKNAGGLWLAKLESWECLYIPVGWGRKMVLTVFWQIAFLLNWSHWYWNKFLKVFSTGRRKRMIWHDLTVAVQFAPLYLHLQINNWKL